MRATRSDDTSVESSEAKEMMFCLFFGEESRRAEAAVWRDCQYSYPYIN